MEWKRFDDELAICGRANRRTSRWVSPGDPGCRTASLGHTPEALTEKSMDSLDVQDDRQWALRACANGKGALVGRAESGSFPFWEGPWVKGGLLLP